MICRAVIRFRCTKTYVELLGSDTIRAYWTRLLLASDLWRADQRSLGGSIRLNENERWQRGNPRSGNVSGRTTKQMNRSKTVSKYLLAIFMVVAGTMHFVKPDFYMKIMPPYLPLHLEAVYLSGFFEVVLGFLLIVPRFSRLAAWGIIALLIAVFPANIYLYQHQELLPASPVLHFLRLPLQAVFILWAYWHTRS